MHAAEETAPDGAVGQRVAVQRKLAGLTQQQLADRALISKSLISQVERGVVPASPAFTATVARALKIDMDVLYEQPSWFATDAEVKHAPIDELRTALDCAGDPILSGPPMTATELRARLDRCEDQRARSRYAEIANTLPELLQHAQVIAVEARSGFDAEVAWSLVSDAYMLAQTVSFRLRHVDLAAHFNDRWQLATGRSGDPLRPAAAAYQRGALRLFRGDYTGVLRIMERAHAEINDEQGAAADSVRTQLHLRQAIAHARSGAADRADEHIGAARELVSRGIPANPYYDVIATATNVELHWVAVPVELSDGTTAVGRAERIPSPEREEPARAGRHWIDVARAWTLHGDRAKALQSLKSARRIAPQLTRYHPQVHETVRILAETDRRATDTLAGFARWIGVTL
ncbi:MAG: helix-turn-helix domain-containing protein [Actinobacteria bacterium]|nr:helix-turn-helix domain-containing protein [Actinomycetota bacterium]